MDRKSVAMELIAAANDLIAADEEGDDVEDPAFAQKVRDLKQSMQKLVNKKNRRLKQFGISDMIRPSNTVADLVDALRRVAV